MAGKKKLDLETFGELMDDFLKKSNVQMLVEMPKGTIEAEITDNLNMGGVIRFYIMLNAWKPVAAQLLKEFGDNIDATGWEEVVDAMLKLAKGEMMVAWREVHE